MKGLPSTMFAATVLEHSPSEEETLKTGNLKRRIIGNSVQWKERMVRLTSDSFCTYNHIGELCENLNLLEIETCRLFEQVPLLLAALFSTFSQSHTRCDC
jgi:hypothetical protein